MFPIVLALLLVVCLAGLVAAFAAYPHRGEAVLHAGRLSDVLLRLTDRFRS